VKHVDTLIVYHHYIEGDPRTGVNEAELNYLHDELFKNDPIKFVARSNQKVDQELKKMIEAMNITIPIIWISKSLYLVGDKKINLEKNGEFVTANIGGGYQNFAKYIQKNHKAFERAIVIKMIQSGESLECVCEAIIEGTKIPVLHSIQYNPVAKTASPSKGSPRGSPTKEALPGKLRFDVVKRPAKPPKTAGASPSRGATFRERPRTSLSSPTKSTSPVRRRKGTIGAKGPVEQPSYEANRKNLLAQLGENEEHRERLEHDGDQTVKENNRAKYAYVHKN
jgi:hypothetical protein